MKLRPLPPAPPRKYPQRGPIYWNRCYFKIGARVWFRGVWMKTDYLDVAGTVIGYTKNKWGRIGYWLRLDMKQSVEAQIEDIRPKGKEKKPQAYDARPRSYSHYDNAATV